MSVRSGAATRLPSNTTTTTTTTTAGKRSKAPPFWAGGAASCVATLVSHPFDLTKVRLQTIRKQQQQLQQQPLQQYRRRFQPSRMFKIMWSISRTEGVRALYNGLSASLLRQGTYSTIRFGLYDKFKWIVAGDDKPTFGQLLFCSTAAGILGGAFGNPSDVVNVRMQNDGQLPPGQRRNYKNAIDGIVRICRDEGPRVLFRGLGSSTNRAVLMTISQMTSYDVFKDMFVGGLKWYDGLTTHFAASLSAALVATTVCSPLDVVKTRIMSAHLMVDGKHHKHPIKIMIHMVKTEGFGSLFKGWMPAFVRLGPHTIVTFLVMEQLKDWYVQWSEKGSEDTVTTPPTTSTTTATTTTLV
ncbi:mitochondrial carrier domain-containing protein [Zychaea mexicana]|uniref:mitochondrial carrier domain-containing protein n=1 Tax=Zychaea mexicana TaxID=64656 RepID=UPI0022FDCB8E|nr:mitochondrial carrier domain-containing protein [Zychaea mexicana]KAI9492951.1 mitochondrial carrier domain-containing protein [Zychaea mexicana]